MDNEKLEFLPITNYQQALFRLKQGEVIVGRLVDDTEMYFTLKKEQVEVSVNPKIGRTRVYANKIDKLEAMINGLFENDVELFCCPGGEVQTVKTFPVKRFIDWLADHLRGEAHER